MWHFFGQKKIRLNATREVSLLLNTYMFSSTLANTLPMGNRALQKTTDDKNRL